MPAVSNGMSAPLNDVALAAFGTAAIFAWAGSTNGRAERGDPGGAVRRAGDRGEVSRRWSCSGCWRWRSRCERDDDRGTRSAAGRLAVLLVYLATALAAGGWWYLRAYIHTGNPVYPFFRHGLRGAGLDEVLAPIKRPLAVTSLNLLCALGHYRFSPIGSTVFRINSARSFSFSCRLFSSSVRRARAARAGRLAICFSGDLHDSASEHAVSC